VGDLQSASRASRANNLPQEPRSDHHRIAAARAGRYSAGAMTSSAAAVTPLTAARGMARSKVTRRPCRL